MAYLKAACRAELKVAEIGAVYGVHGATASRWVHRARARLAELVYADLTDRLRISGSEAQSLLRSAMSELELTLQRLLATGA